MTSPNRRHCPGKLSPGSSHSFGSCECGKLARKFFCFECNPTMADAEPVQAPEVTPGPHPEDLPADSAPEAPADLPGPAWDDLVAELEPQPHELACQLLQDHGTPGLMAWPALFSALVFPSMDRSCKTLLLLQPISGNPTCTLVALPDRATALHDLLEMFEIDPQGGCCTTLGGGAPTRCQSSSSFRASAISPA
jgi:hypothetical protein